MSQSQVRVRVPAKINLSLRVGPPGPDGYHPLWTVFEAVSLHDDVTASRAPDGVFELACVGEGADRLPLDDENLAMRAARELAARHGGRQGVRLEIHKRIPVAGGMAGGSADAAGALVACSSLWGLDVGLPELTRIGATLGADVPFALMGGLAVGVGRGDVLTPLPRRGRRHWVLAFGHHGLSTPAVFGEFDRSRTPAAPLPDERLLAALAEADPAALAETLGNDLQDAAIALRPAVGAVLRAGEEAGALAGLVSGSGPTCAFLVADEADAARVAERLRGSAHVRTVRRAEGPVSGARVLAMSPC